MSVISKNTSIDLALAHREIETAKKLLAEIEDAVSRRTAPDIRDAFGRLSDGLQLGVPSGDNGHRLFNVPWSLAKPIIENHIAQKTAELQILTERAVGEAEALSVSNSSSERGD